MSDTGGHIFLSHGSENRHDANALTTYLEERGLNVWIAPRNVRPGVDYSEALQEAIEGCAAFIVLVTDKANKSPYVRVETEMAFSLHKPIFPVRTGEVKPGPGLALFLKIRHWTDAYGPQREESLERLAAELRSIAGVPDPAPAAAPPVETADAAAPAEIPPAAPEPPQPATSHWPAPAAEPVPAPAPGPVAPGPAKGPGGLPMVAVAAIVGGFVLLLVALYFMMGRSAPAPQGNVTMPGLPVPQAQPAPQPQPQGAQPQAPQQVDPNQPQQPQPQDGEVYDPPAEGQEPPTEGYYDPPQ